MSWARSHRRSASAPTLPAPPECPGSRRCCKCGGPFCTSASDFGKLAARFTNSAALRTAVHFVPDSVASLSTGQWPTSLPSTPTSMRIPRPQRSSICARRSGRAMRSCSPRPSRQAASRARSRTCWTGPSATLVRAPSTRSRSAGSTLLLEEHHTRTSPSAGYSATWALTSSNALASRCR
jgi:hypothetical protein